MLGRVWVRFKEWRADVRMCRHGSTKEEAKLTRLWGCSRAEDWLASRTEDYDKIEGIRRLIGWWNGDPMPHKLYDAVFENEAFWQFNDDHPLNEVEVKDRMALLVTMVSKIKSREAAR